MNKVWGCKVQRCRVRGCKVQGCRAQRAAAVACALLLLGAQLSAQGKVANAALETRSAAQGFDREVAAVAARRGGAWLGYKLPIVPGQRQLCSTVALEPPSEFMLLARFDQGKVVRLRTLTPNCEVDAGGMPVVWLNDVSSADSVRWLSTLVNEASSDRDAQALSRSAIAAIGLHASDAAPQLIQIVRTTTNRNLRRQAMNWLGQSKDPRATAFFEDVLKVK
jgi:hypothetical protein